MPTTGAQKGRSLLIKVTDGTSPVTYNTLAGLRPTTLAIDSSVVDVTNKDSNAWQELLAGAGVRKAAITGGGVFKNSTTEELARGFLFAQSLNPMQLVFENGRMFTGSFFISKIDFAGEYNKEVVYTITLESSGPITFVAGT